MKKRIAVLSGAGISAESGIKTFRDSNGLWEGHHVEDVATPEGWERNPELVLDFYNQRRRQLLEVQPNEGHFILAELEQHFNVRIITQNVDNLHEQAGSSQVLHLHGELLKVRSENNPNMVLDWRSDLHLTDKASDGSRLRPHIVWFGEAVPELQRAAAYCDAADILIVVGTSLQVYPAAGLIDYVQPGTPVYYVDPNPAIVRGISNLKVYNDIASTGLRKVQQDLLDML
jgi:NAD-dependent deacetylase